MLASALISVLQLLYETKPCTYSLYIFCNVHFSVHPPDDWYASIQSRFSILVTYSYRNASIGERLAARRAGAAPKINPTTVETPRASPIAPGVTSAGMKD